jgi:mRNA-degrading endonuclease RelE of RelBE toxin-antitoxin system
VSYRLEWYPGALESLLKLGRVADALIAHAERVAENPYRLGGPLGAEWEGCYSARLPGLRLVYEIDDAEERVIIHRAERRGHAYRRGR